MRGLVRPIAFMRSRWRIWAPPLVFTVVIFIAVILLTKGKAAVPYLYRLF
jgi:hypothetical protein